LTTFIKLLGWILARTPEPILASVAAGLGTLIFTALPRRRRVVLSNLVHAYPQRSPSDIKRLGRQSCQRLVETALLSLASPFLGNLRLLKIACAGPGVEAMLVERRASPRPTVLASAHLAYWETQTWLGLLSRTPIGDFGVIYRPLDNPRADAFVRQTRERFGMRLLSRKEGFAQALKILRNQGCIGVLFDQNAGLQGALTTLFERVCSTTELPGILAQKFEAEVRIIFAVRRAFWRVELRIETLRHDGSAEGVTIGLNRWLEDKLSTDPNLCASWLWSHDRWRNQDMPRSRLSFAAKRNLLDEEIKMRGWLELPRRTRVFIRLPNWLGDVVMALPLIRALRTSRPDAEITLIGKAQFRPLFELTGLNFEHYQPLPERGFRYWFTFRNLRHRYPDFYLLLTHSLRGDLEAWLTGCRQRFGIERPGRRRPLLSHVYRVPESGPLKPSHQIAEWQAFFEEFGLKTAIDRHPFARTQPVAPGGPPHIGLIAGSENNPAKRWPVSHWRAIIDMLPNVRFSLFGTLSDRRITDEIAADFPPDHVENLAGRTDLLAFGRALQACHLLISNDTGGMHLANALGVPIIGLFGPTNPVRTGPVFNGPVVVLQPPGCPATGGANLIELEPKIVLDSVHHLLPGIASNRD